MFSFHHALVLALLLGTQAADIPYSKCGPDSLGIEQISISEWPIHPGHSITFDLKFSPKMDITSGILSLAVMLRGAEVFSDSHDLCSGTGLACPLVAGQEVALSKTQTIPENTPPLKGLTVKVVTMDGNSSTISCIEADIALASDEEEMASLPAIDGSLLGDVAMARTTWTPHWSPRFANATLKQARSMMGTWLRGHPLHMELPLKEEVFGVVAGMEENDTIPVSFDSREAWPECKEVIGKVKDQSACGSCWAFASSSAFEDRMCIAHGSKDLLSPTDTLSCCQGAACGFSQGCNGGQPAGAWSFFATTGIVSGGLFEEVGSGTSCLPYPFLTCAHHVEPTESLPACPAEDFETPRCRKTCSETEYEAAYYVDKRKAKRGYAVRSVESIQREIMENGPVSAAFNVYQDFLAYQGGVYQHTTGMPLGGHAVKLIGWGEEAGIPYWLVMNSWNQAWGEAGLFRIIRGQDECGFESDITAGSV